MLDWSDGAMIALHFALGNPSDDVKANDAVVYVLSWSLLKAKIDQTTDAQSLPTLWREYVGRVREKRRAILQKQIGRMPTFRRTKMIEKGLIFRKLL